MRPWRDSTHKQRLNPANGILLVANLDAVFDRFLISFDDDGHMRVSDRIKAIMSSIVRTLGTFARRPDRPGEGLSCLSPQQIPAGQVALGLRTLPVRTCPTRWVWAIGRLNCWNH
ncbi:MAG: HNH endonuclease [Stellaceae bacterium]